MLRESKAQKPRPVGQNEKRAPATSVEDELERSEVLFLGMLSVDLSKLEISDLGDEFNLENFPFSENVDSDESRGSSRAISETTISFVEAFALAPSELRLMEKEIRLPLVQSGSADSRIKVNTGNLSVGDVSLLASTFCMMLGRNMVHCGTEFHQLSRGNYLTSTRAIQMSRRWGHESSSHLLPSYPLLGRGQTTAMSELLHPGKCPDKSLETTVRDQCVSP